MKRKGVAWIGLAFIILIVGGIFYWKFSVNSGDSNQEQLEGKVEIQSSIARTGDLTFTVSGTGELVPVSEAELSFQESGELVELNVKVGDKVQEGDVLARLRIDQTEAELAASLANAELEVLEAQQNLDQLYEDSQLAAAQALRAAEESQLSFDELQNFEVERALAQQEMLHAEEAVQKAEENLALISSSPSQQSLDITHASLLFKEKALKEIEQQIVQVEHQYKSALSKEVREILYQRLLNLRVQYANQQLEYDNALYKYNTLGDPPEAVVLTLAEAQLSTAQEQLGAAQREWEQAEVGPSAGELALAEAQLTEAQDEWKRLKDGPNPDEVAFAKAQLAKAKAQFAMLQAGQLVLDLVAPMDGTVLSINAGIGDRINDSPILTLAYLSKPVVEVYLDESDLAYVQAGDQAEVTFDAIPEFTFQAQVMQVEPSLINLGSASAVRAWVSLEDEPDRLASLPLGLNASVDIVSGEALNAVLVPIDSLLKNQDGSYTVFVVSGGQVEQRAVQVGLMDATTAEIVAGLQAGEEVAIGTLILNEE